MPRPTANRTGEVELLYNPYQAAFLNALGQRTPAGLWAFTRLSLFSGRRGGKTKIGAIGAVQKMRQPDSMGWVCAPTYPDLHDFVMPAVFGALPEGWIKDYSAQYLTLTLTNGALCSFRSLEDPERARGPGLDWCWIDETRKVVKTAWDTMLPALVDRRGQAFFTTSPNGFDWCYRSFWLPAQLGEPGYWACKYRTSENPFISPEELASARRQLDPLFYAQEFEADFVTFTGAVYGTAIESQVLHNDGEIQAILPEWPKLDADRACILAVDPGSDHPFAGVLLVVCEKGLVVVGEYLARNKPAHEHVRGLHQLLGERSPRRALNPDRWAIDRSQKQWVIELAQHGLYFTPAENSVTAGINRVHSWLGARQLWFAESACPRLLEQMRNYRWAENTAPDGQSRKEAVIKLDDDLPDALRYGLMLWPELPEVDTQATSKRALTSLPEDVRWQVERMRRIDGRETGLDDLGEPDDLASLEDEAEVDRYTGPPVGNFFGA